MAARQSATLRGGDRRQGRVHRRPAARRRRARHHRPVFRGAGAHRPAAARAAAARLASRGCSHGWEAADEARRLRLCSRRAASTRRSMCSPARAATPHPRRRPDADADAQHAPRQAERWSSTSCASPNWRASRRRRHGRASAPPCARPRCWRRPDLRATQPLLAAALPWIGHVQTRSRGTVCGSIAHADPSAEIAAGAAGARRRGGTAHRNADAPRTGRRTSSPA